MHARTTTVLGDPSALDDGIAAVRDEVLPAVRDLPGCLGLSMLADRHSGRCIIGTTWQDADAMHRSADAVRPLRGAAVHALRGAEAAVEEWSVDVLSRARPAPETAAVRIIRTGGPAGPLDRVVDCFRSIVVPRAQHLPGFCGVSLLLDHDTGRSTIAATYESRHTMNRARGQAVAIREEFLDRMGMHVEEIAEFDLVLADLRVPEMA